MLGQSSCFCLELNTSKSKSCKLAVCLNDRIIRLVFVSEGKVDEVVWKEDKDKNRSTK